MYGVSVSHKGKHTTQELQVVRTLSDMCMYYVYITSKSMHICSSYNEAFITSFPTESCHGWFVLNRLH